jgi:antitoxin (DNA-binding transcriptional repressor) of toxin-antitoxin stability system
VSTPRTVSASEARTALPEILDEAEHGRTTVVLRHSRVAAAIIPAGELETYNLVRRILSDLGETIQISRDPEIIAAVHRAQDRINRGEIVWDDEE